MKEMEWGKGKEGKGMSGETPEIHFLSALGIYVNNISALTFTQQDVEQAR